MRHASTWVQSKYITLSRKSSEQEKALSDSLLEPGCLSRRIPINVVDHILSYVSQSDLGWWSPSEQILLRPKIYRSVYDLDISWIHSMQKIRSALQIPRFDLNILADTTSPEFLIDDGNPDNEAHPWSRIEDVEEYLEKLAAASELTTRIKSFNLQLVMAYNTYSLFLSAAARSFWYAEALIVQTAVSRCDEYNVNFEDDTLSEIQNILLTTPHGTGPPKPESVVLTSPLLGPFVAAGILASTTHLTLTASASFTFEYIPQEVTAGLPCLRKLNMYDICEDPGQPTIHFGLVSDLRVPSLSFIDICSPSNEVRCLGIKVTNDDLDRLGPDIRKITWTQIFTLVNPSQS